MGASLILQMQQIALHMGGTAYDYFNYTVKDNESSDDHNADLSGIKMQVQTP